MIIRGGLELLHLLNLTGNGVRSLEIVVGGTSSYYWDVPHFINSLLYLSICIIDITPLFRMAICPKSDGYPALPCGCRRGFHDLLPNSSGYGGTERSLLGFGGYHIVIHAHSACTCSEVRTHLNLVKIMYITIV